MALSLNLKASETQRIVCYHCTTAQDVSRRAQTVTCRKCNKALQVGDLTIKAYDARRKVQTTGHMIVERKGQIIGESIDCAGLVVRGQIKVKSSVTVRGTALIGADTTVLGDVRAHRLAVGLGATLAGHYCVGKDEMVPPVVSAEE